MVKLFQNHALKFLGEIMLCGVDPGLRKKLAKIGVFELETDFTGAGANGIRTDARVRRVRIGGHYGHRPRPAP